MHFIRFQQHREPIVTEHILKTVEPFFTAVLDGEKTFEVRLNDRAYQRGDTLVLLDTSRCDCRDLACAKRRPPIRKTVSFVFSGSPALRDLGGIVPGHVVLGVVDIPAGSDK